VSVDSYCSHGRGCDQWDERMKATRGETDSFHGEKDTGPIGSVQSLLRGKFAVFRGVAGFNTVALEVK
jgi:hypothetical protein